MGDPGGGISSAKRRHRLRWWTWVLLGVVLLAVGGGSFVWVEHARSVALGATSPQDGSILPSATVRIVSGLPGFEPGRGVVAVSIDGTHIPSDRLTLHDGFVEAEVALADGAHQVILDYSSSNIFSRRLTRAWGFSVDTTPPTISVISPASRKLLTESITRIEIAVDEPSTVQVRVDGAPGRFEAGAFPDGELGPGPFAGDLMVEEGEHRFEVIATDGVGNASSVVWDSYADYQAPVIAATAWPQPGEPWRETSASGTFTVSDALPQNLTVGAALDGAELALTPGPATTTERRAYSLETGDLAEGEHRLVLTARDRGGHETRWENTFLVDSSSTFGDRPMGEGAVGNDVAQLQRALARKGFYEGDATAVYDDLTSNAVAAYNAAHGLTVGAAVAADTLAAIIGSIRIDLSERKLYHYSDGALRKTYSVAVGMPAYPTPTGSFEIISKIVDPTWTPPDSDWAQGMEPVGPGPGNPLGTRWMGINSPSVGIHGTYTSSSIGTAASHGCIRMHLQQAEELFELVFVGTPVEIVP